MLLDINVNLPGGHKKVPLLNNCNFSNNSNTGEKFNEFLINSQILYSKYERVIPDFIF